MSNYEPQYGEAWDRQATGLYETAVLSRRQAQTYILTKQGRSRDQVAELFDISLNTVDEHRQQLLKRIALAENTVRTMSKRDAELDESSRADSGADGEEDTNE